MQAEDAEAELLRPIFGYYQFCAIGGRLSMSSRCTALRASLMVTGLVAFAAQAQSLQVDATGGTRPLTAAILQDYAQQKPSAAKATLGASDTVAGFAKLCRGEVDALTSPRPIGKREQALCAERGAQYVEVAVAMDGLAIIVNPKNTQVSNISVEELRKLWDADAQGKLTRWNQVRADWPQAPFALIAPDVASGSADAFAGALGTKTSELRHDYSASTDESVIVQGVGRDLNAHGYVGYAYVPAAVTRAD